MADKKTGSITVFLVFVSVLIFALVGTLIEGSRITYGKTLAERGLLSAGDSLLTQYYAPLYRDYHLFFLEKGIDPEVSETEVIQDSIKDYLFYTLDPGKDLTFGPLDTNIDLVKLSLSNLEVRNLTHAVDENGDIFIKEATAYMKYKDPESIAEQLLNGISFFQKAEKTTKVIQKKLEAEEYMNLFQKDIMKVMELIEGISYGKNGLKYTRKGLLKTTNSFCKLICPGNITQENVAINNTIVWNSLKNKYIDMKAILNTIQNDIEKIIEYRQSINDCKNQLNSFSDITSFNIKKKDILYISYVQQKSVYRKAAAKKTAAEKTDADLQEEELRKQEEERRRKEEKRRALREKISKLEKQINNRIRGVDKSIKKLTKAGEATKKRIQETLKYIPELEKKQKTAKSNIESYGDELELRKKEVEESIYKGLKEDLSEMRQYNQKALVSILEMKPVLERNMALLEEIIALKDMKIQKDYNELSLIASHTAQIQNQIQNYDIKSLSFDYSSLVDNSDTKDPINSLENTLKSGLLELVIEDINKISEKKIREPDRLWLKYQKNQQKEDKETTTGVFSSPDIGREGGLAKLFENYGKSMNNTIGNLTNNWLFHQYLMEHFKGYLEEETENPLSYEREYILKGKGTDKENLISVMDQIILIRTILNFVSLLSDKNKGDLAYGAAAALVGFTGLEPLVRFTKTLILFVWAFEEGLVDMASLFEKEKVPLFKTGQNFRIQFEDLFVFSKDLIKRKKREASSSEKSMISLDYQDYITMFLLFQKQEKTAYRSMDLIERNMQHHYNDLFSIEKGIFSFDLKAEFKIPQKFVRLPFIHKILESDSSNFLFSVSLPCSY